MISLTDTQSKRCRVPTLAGAPAAASAPLRPAMNGTSAAWGGGPREGGGGYGRTADLPWLKWHRHLRPGDMDPPPYQVSGVAGMGLSACA